MTIPASLVDARSTLANYRVAIRSAVDDLAQKEELLEQARRVNGGIETAISVVAAARASLDGAYASYDNALATVQVELNAWVPQSLSPNDEFDRLWAKHSITLFPCRLETRFDRSARTLRVRIYPDEILMNTHEALLTREEAEAGRAFYNAVHLATNKSGAELEEWTKLIEQFDRERAAYILKALSPEYGAGFNLGKWVGYAATPSDQPMVPPSVDYRSETWTRPAEATLPDRWIVTASRDQKIIHQVKSGAIREPLAMTFDPSAPLSRRKPPAHNANGYQNDAQIQWTVDFQEAVAAGMAVEIPNLSDIDLDRGFDRLVVIGVKTSLPLLAGADCISDLFEAHRFSRGFEMLRDGTPTNSTEGVTAPFPRVNGDPAASLAVERGALPPNRDRDDFVDASDSNSDGGLLGKALGVSPLVTRYLDGERNTFHRGPAEAMNRVLWPATLGYFIDEMMDPVFSSAADKAKVGLVQGFFEYWVHGQGYAPAFRVGSAAYGVLPSSSLKRWQRLSQSSNVTGQLGDVEDTVREFLLTLRNVWLKASAGVPRVSADREAQTSGQTNRDANLDMLEAMALEARSSTVWAREAVAKEISTNFSWFNGINPAELISKILQYASRPVALIGKPGWNPRAAQFVHGEYPGIFSGPLVAGPNGGTAASYIDSLIANDRTIEQLRSDNFLTPVPDSLLYVMLRHSYVLQIAKNAWRIARENVSNLQKDGNPFTLLRAQFERVLWSVYESTADEDTIWDLMEAKVGGVGQTLGERAFAETTLLRTWMGILKNENESELADRLMDTLDVCSHRLDAWISALAAQRLHHLQSESTYYYFASAYFGAYAVVENLKPRDRTTAIVDGQTVEVDPIGGGYVHTPSLAHAGAAAILRNGYLSYRKDDPTRYAFDLSSHRVRVARELLDQVREGQPLGALLGYRFERVLHELNKNQWVAPFRKAFPLVAGVVEEPNDDAIEKRAARSVVNGLELIRRYRDHLVSFGQNGLPAVSHPDFPAIQAAIEGLEEPTDAVSDLLTAEAVFQTTQGNVERAGAAMDALAGKVDVPDPEFVQIPRGGTGITHRVAIVVTGDAPNLPVGWYEHNAEALQLPPRAISEPGFDRWFADLLGDPSTIECAVFNGTSLAARVSVSQLQVRPLDFVQLVHPVLESRAAPALALEAHILYAANVTPGESIRIDYTNAQPGKRSFARAFEIIRVALSVLGAGRPMQAADVMTAVDGTNSAASSYPSQIGFAINRITIWTNQRIAAAGNDLAARRQALRDVAVMLTSDRLPTPEMDDAGLTSLASELTVLAQQRQSAASEIFDATNALATGPATMKALFGDAFISVPSFGLPHAAALSAAAIERNNLLTLDGASQPDPHAPSRFLEQAARAREGVARYRRLRSYRRAFGSVPEVDDVLQLPVKAGARWVGLAGPRPQAGTLSLVIVGRASKIAVTPPWSGVVLDEWTEAIPNDVEQTGVALHFDSPRAPAPNLVIAAVPPRDATWWSFDDVLDIVNETVDLAKVRAVHTDNLGELSQLIPALFVADSQAKLTVHTPIRRSRTRARPIVEDDQ
jgi:hypothetical protein